VLPRLRQFITKPRPSSGGYLPFNGDGSPLRVLLSSYGVCRRMLDPWRIGIMGVGSERHQMVTSQGATAFGGLSWGLSGQITGTRPILLVTAFLFFVVTVGWLLLFGRSRESLTVKGEAPWLSAS
jgi:hypothetical protein